MKTYKYILTLVAMLILMPLSFAEEKDHCKNLPEIISLKKGQIDFKDTVFYFEYGGDKQPTVKKSKTTVHDRPLVFFKAVKKERIIYEEVFDFYNSDAPTSFVSVNCDSQLKDVELMITFYFSGESCGSPDTKYNYAWNGERLLELPGTKSMPDAEYTYSESLLLPSQTHLPNMLMLIIEQGKGFDGDKWRADKEIVLYEWDGLKATKVKQKQIRKISF